MQKPDYVKNTSGEGISEDILECFYDNICYTPFIHVEDDLEINGERAPSRKSRKSLFPRSSSETPKRVPKEPVDPYTLIIDQRLDFLRPNLKDVMNGQDPYKYVGTAKTLDIKALQRTFFRSGVLQIVSARSRPEAFKSPMTITNPQDAHPGVVDIKITKVGILWRKESRKKKTRSPWQEWGAILTGSQLYFFRNTAWIRNLLHQYELHQKNGQPGTPVVFKPPLESFKPDALMSTDDAVALLDSSYKKHKNAFIFVRHGGFEETLLADSESDMNDWLSKLNYAAAFRTASVRMRATIGSTSDVQRSKSIRRTETGDTNPPSSSGGEVQASLKTDGSLLSQQILVARRQIMLQKIREADEKLLVANSQLEHQLRNLRHLQILAPIQSKSREQIILAAGRMAAKLKWTRLEMWRVKCHRDILALDLEDERASMTGAEASDQTTAYEFESGGLGIDSQKATKDIQKATSGSTVSQRKSPRLPSRPSSKDQESSKEDASKTSASSLLPSSPQRGQVSRAVTPQLSIREGSDLALTLSRVGSLNERTSNPESFMGLTQGSPPGIVKLLTRESSVDQAEAEVLKEAGLVHIEGSPAEPRHVDVARQGEDQHEPNAATVSEGEGNDKSKIRRSLHRTLREAHVPTHHRSKKGRDSSSSIAITEDGSLSTEKEGLARGTGSFTLHGKKASVITFGSEWQNMTPEERLKPRKPAHNEDHALQASNISEGVAVMSDISSAKSPGRGSMLSTSPLLTGSARSSTIGDVLPTTSHGNQGELGLASTSDQRRGGNLAVMPDRAEDSASMQQSHESTPSSGKSDINVHRTSAAATLDEEYQSAAEDVNAIQVVVHPRVQRVHG